LKLLPVVSYAVERKIAGRAGRPDYWDRATRLELAVLAKQEVQANESLAEALASVREAWEPETTRRNLQLVSKVRKKRGEEAGCTTTPKTTRCKPVGAANRKRAGRSNTLDKKRIA
jgi:hypothetical protein